MTKNTIYMTLSLSYIGLYIGLKLNGVVLAQRKYKR